MLPSPTNVHQKNEMLAHDIHVKVIDLVNASKTKKQLIEELLGHQDKDQPLDLEDTQHTTGTEKNNCHGGIYGKSVRDEYKYTVQDGNGTTAFLISTGRWNLGSALLVKQGTELWRSVLIPRENQVQCTQAGRPLSNEEMLHRLQSEIKSPVRKCSS